MNTIHHPAESHTISTELPFADSEGHLHLVTISHDSSDRFYRILLEADISRVSLEGMNKYTILLGSRHKDSDLQELLRAELELNLRREMNSVSIEGSSPHFFSVTRKSLDINDTDIDSSIHEAVDLVLMDLRSAASSHNGFNRSSCILFDALSASFIKAGISSLLALSTWAHKEVIHNANHLFASRQDYVRDMTVLLGSREKELTDSILVKAIHSDHCLL